MGYLILSSIVCEMNIEANKVIGKCLYRLRLEAELTQLQLSKKLGKPQSYVSKIEAGERSLQVYELFGYSKALGLSPEEVVRKFGASLRG